MAFVQLNYNPDHQISFKSYDSFIVKNRHFNITKSHKWLKRDLASNKDKKTVLHIHKISNNDEKLSNILDENPQVVAIFTGHTHDRVGIGAIDDSDKYVVSKDHSLDREIGFTFKTNGDRVIPIYYSGSSENNLYLHAAFRNNKLIIRPVDSLNGQVNYINQLRKALRFFQLKTS